MNQWPHVRDAVFSDMDRITEIYAHYVRTSIATFEQVAPGRAEMTARFEEVTGQKLPWLVAESETGVDAFAYATLWRRREAYRHAVEDSIYVDVNRKRQGLGRVLLSELIIRCEDLGKRRMIAVVAGRDSLASIGLHAHVGFSTVGVLPSVGYKFGRWIDTVLMSRELGPGDTSPPDG